MPDLVCHPATPCAVVTRVQVTVESATHLIYTLTGALDRVRLPDPGIPQRMDRLWEHTCVEAFFLEQDASAYTEFNLAPSGNWQAYAFAAYRARGADPVLAPPILKVNRTDHSVLTLEAHLPPLPRPCSRLALAAVVEEDTGALSYWALHHPVAAPDFHHPDSFTLQVSP